MSKDSSMTYLMLAGAAALGALTMYFFDPERGRHRRTVCTDKLSSAADTAVDAAESTTRDLTNRARGVLAEAKSVVNGGGQSREDEMTSGGLAAA